MIVCSVQIHRWNSIELCPTRQVFLVAVLLKICSPKTCFFLSICVGCKMRLKLQVKVYPRHFWEIEVEETMSRTSDTSYLLGLPLEGKRKGSAL